MASILIAMYKSQLSRLVIPGIAVSPGVTHSDSHHLCYGTVVTARHFLFLSLRVHQVCEILLQLDHA